MKTKFLVKLKETYTDKKTGETDNRKYWAEEMPSLKGDLFQFMTKSLEGNETMHFIHQSQILEIVEVKLKEEEKDDILEV